MPGFRQAEDQGRKTVVTGEGKGKSRYGKIDKIVEKMSIYRLNDY